MSALKDLREPLILSVEDFGSDTDDHPYLVLPYEMAQMETVADRLQRGTLTEEECGEILTDVSTALVLAHQHNLIHGCFSSESVLLTPEGQVRVSAFLSSGPGISIEHASLPIQYRFPESDAGRLSDQYALAGLVQDLLLGQDEIPEDATILSRGIAQAQAQDPMRRFKSIRDFLGEIGIPLHLAESDKELDPVLQNFASLNTRHQSGVEYESRARVAFIYRSWIWLRFWVCLVGTGLLTIAMLFSLIQYLGSWQYTVNNGEQLELSASRGENIVVNVQMKYSINGLWASEHGLQLKLDEQKQPLPVVPPTSKSWDDVILTNAATGGDESFTVHGSFTLPSSLSGPEIQDLHGWITGHVLYPAGGGFGGFEDTDTTVSIPVYIHVIPEGLRQRNSGKSTFWAMAALEGVLLAGMLLALQLAKYQHGPMIIFAYVVGETGHDRIICLRGLICGVLLGGLLTGITQLFHTAVMPSSLMLTNFLIFVGAVVIFRLLKSLFAALDRASGH